MKRSTFDNSFDRSNTPEDGLRLGDPFKDESDVLIVKKNKKFVERINFKK